LQSSRQRHDEEILEAKAERSVKNQIFRYLNDISNNVEFFYKELKNRGKPHRSMFSYIQMMKSNWRLQYLNTA